MPRTKVSRNTKRNRDAAIESMMNRTREFDLYVEQWLSDLDLGHQQRLDENRSITNMIRTMPQKILNMKISEIFAFDAATVNEIEALLDAKENAKKSIMNSSLLRSAKKKSRDDEGYLTEDSGSNIPTASAYSAFTRGTGTTSARAVGPLSSAKAKARKRRSRSAGYLNNFSSASSIRSASTTASGSTVTSSQTSTDRMSRSKMRTPLKNRSKAMSADRAAPVTPKFCPNTPLSMLRYPRFGETVISLSGSPVVAQCGSDSSANVNIPIRDGVLSLRPTRMETIDPDFIHRIDGETLNQIKQLQSNLNIIMSFADKAFTSSKI